MIDPAPSNPQLPRLSLVVTSYQQGEYLEETLRSIFDQDYPDLELLVIDGGSTDGSREILERYDDRIDHWVSEPDRGQSHAINKGFARATGELVTFVASDDVYEPGAFAAAARRFRERPEVGAVIGGFQNVDAAGRPVGEAVAPRLPPCATDAGETTPVDLTVCSPGSWRLHQVATFYSRHALDAVGREVREDLRYTMDRELLYRVLARFPAALDSTRVYGRFRRHDASKSVSVILPFGLEMAELHRGPGRARRRVYRQRRAAALLKLETALAGRPASALALLRALRWRPGLLARAGYLRRWLRLLGLLPLARRLRRIVPRRNREATP